jgi:hypothetical protein
MAGLADIIRSGIATADSITSTLQADVLHYRYSEATVDDSGKITWGSPHQRKAVVEHARTHQRDKEGREVLSDTQLTFPRPFDVDPRDRFVLPDGTGDGPPNRVAGVVDPVTKKVYMIQIWIGSNRIT